jgi:pimeloyl-ACP methyl ester carboxylesterase
VADLELEYRIMGTGNTTLIFETGIGNSFYSWLDLAEKMSKDFTIVLYHRAGYGKSKLSHRPRDVRTIAEELDSLVGQLDIKESFVLVGHSFGGLCAQQYAKMFPKKLKGMVLIDSTSANFQKIYDLDLPVMWSCISLEKMIKGSIESSSKTRGELEDDNKAAIQEAEKLSQEHFTEYKAFLTTPALYKTIAEEFQNWPNDSVMINASGEFPDIPLTVITRDQDISSLPFIGHGIPEGEAHLHERMWRVLQEELSQLNTAAEFFIADGSDHEIHKDRPDIIIECLQKFK